MGNENSTAAMEKTVFNMKFTSKQLAQESKRCEKKMREEEAKCLKAMDSGNVEIARVYAANAIREKSQAANFVRIASRIDAVAGRVETAIRMNTLTKQIVSVTHGMDSILGSMDVGKIANVMDKFESQFETLDVRTGHMDRAMAASTSTAVPEDEVEELMGRVKAKRDLDVKGDMVSAGTGAIGAAAGAGAEKARTAEAVSAAAPPAAGAGGKPDEKGGPSDGKGSGSGGGGGGGGGAAAPADSLSARLAALRK